MLKKLFTFGFDHIMLHCIENQLFMLSFPSEMPLFGASEGFQKGFCSRIPTEKCDSGKGDATKN